MAETLLLFVTYHSVCLLGGRGTTWSVALPLLPSEHGCFYSLSFRIVFSWSRCSCESLMCLWEKGISGSAGSTILILPLELIFVFRSFLEI